MRSWGEWQWGLGRVPSCFGVSVCWGWMVYMYEQDSPLGEKQDSILRALSMHIWLESLPPRLEYPLPWLFLCSQEAKHPL